MYLSSRQSKTSLNSDFGDSKLGIVSWEEALMSCFSCFIGNAIFCSLFCPVISPSTKILWSADNDQMESSSILVCEAESNILYCGLSLCLYCRSGSLICVEGLVTRSINHPYIFFVLLSNGTEAYVLCGECPFYTLNPIHFLVSETSSLVCFEAGQQKEVDASLAKKQWHVFPYK